MSREAMLARTMVELADTLVDDFDIVDLLSTLSDRCVEVLDVAAVGIVLAEPGTDLRVMASSSEATRELEASALETQEGPGWDCHRSGDRVVAEDLAAATGRWPQFAPAAVAAGFQAVVAVPMRLRAVVIGAVDLFRRGPTSLSEDDIIAAQALADLATIAILQHHAIREVHDDNVQLGAALRNRVVIEQATGMVAERQGVDPGRAFARIRNHAQTHGLPIVDIASAIIDGSFNAEALDTRGT